MLAYITTTRGRENVKINNSSVELINFTLSDDLEHLAIFYTITFNSVERIYKASYSDVEDFFSNQGLLDSYDYEGNNQEDFYTLQEFIDFNDSITHIAHFLGVQLQDIINWCDVVLEDQYIWLLVKYNLNQIEKMAAVFDLHLSKTIFDKWFSIKGKGVNENLEIVATNLPIRLLRQFEQIKTEFDFRAKKEATIKRLHLTQAA